MQFYEYGVLDKPVMMLIPGTFCHHTLFDEVVTLLEEYFHVIVVSFDGFDESEDSEFTSMDEEINKIEQYIKDKLKGNIFGMYGSALGGNVVSYILQRNNVHIEHAFIGSSDLDYEQGLKAKLLSDLMTNIIMKPIYNHELPSLLKKRINKKIKENPKELEYYEKINLLLLPYHEGFPSKKSIYNEFYCGLTMKIEDNIDAEGTDIHIFYAMKMGDQYLDRYEQHFINPDIHYHNLNHEELLLCTPKDWVKEVLDSCNMFAIDLPIN